MRRTARLLGLPLFIVSALHAGEATAGGGGAVSQTETFATPPGLPMAIVRLAAELPDRAKHLNIVALTNNNRVLLSNDNSGYRWQAGLLSALDFPADLLSDQPGNPYNLRYWVSDMNESGAVVGTVRFDRNLAREVGETYSGSV